MSEHSLVDWRVELASCAGFAVYLWAVTYALPYVAEFVRGIP
jgi:hypothetical protein